MSINATINLKDVDYAGGTVIHLTWYPGIGLVVLAVAGFVACMILRKRNPN